MRVIPPLTVTPAMLVSSTIAEPAAGETAWVSGTTYAVGDIRILTSTHRQYIRLVAGAGTTSPDVDLTNWADNGPTNKWAMFDLLRNTASSLPSSPIVVVITPGKRIDSIGLVGLQASSVSISVDIGATNYYAQTTSTIKRGTSSWSTYFYGAFRYASSLVRFDIPPITGATITITITNTTGTVKCGGLVMGFAVYLGAAEYNAVRSALNFSTVTRDAFGNATLVQRRSVPKTDQKLFTPKSMVTSILQLISDLNAVPALWSGLDDQTTNDYFEALLILGIYKEVSVDVAYPNNAQITLQLEEI